MRKIMRAHNRIIQRSLVSRKIISLYGKTYVSLFAEHGVLLLSFCVATVSRLIKIYILAQLARLYPTDRHRPRKIGSSGPYIFYSVHAMRPNQLLQ